MSLPFDPTYLTEAASAMGLSPEYIRTALNNPEMVTRMVELARQSAQSHSAQTTIPSSSGANSVDELGDEFSRLAIQFKERSERERQLSPAKAPPLLRAHMIIELEYKRKENAEQLSDKRSIYQTYIGLPQEFSSTPVEKLKQILVPQMLIRKTHKGNYLICRVIARPSRIVGIMLGVEDSEGNPARLSIYNYPTLLQASLRDLDAIFPIGAVLLVREPTYKMTSMGNAAMIRVDSPSDVQVLVNDHPLLKNVTWRTSLTSLEAPLPNLPTTVDGWRARGGAEFKQDRWLSAAVCYTNGLQLKPDTQVLRLNRAETYLRLGWNFSALCDLESVAKQGDITDANLKRKALLRTIRANYGLGRYEKVVQLAEEQKDDNDCKEWLLKAKQRLAERSAGAFNWCALFKDGQKPGSRLDVADFAGPVEVRAHEDQPDVRGVFATRDVNIGELLIVAKPLSSGHASDTNLKTSQFMAFNFLSMKVSRLEQTLLIVRLVQRLWDDAEASSALHAMYAGPSFARCDRTSVATERRPLSHPLISAVDIDVPRIEAVVSLNSFRHPPTSALLYTDEKAGDEDEDEMTAIYDLPSFCNHECIPSGNRLTMGDVMIIRAARNLRKGEEVTLQYVPTVISYLERQKQMQQWKFNCKCMLCVAEQDGGKERCGKREKLVGEITALLSKSKSHSLSERTRQGLLERGREIIGELRKVSATQSSDKSPLPDFSLFLALCALASLIVGRDKPAITKETLELIHVEMEILVSVGIVISDREVHGTGLAMPIDTSHSYSDTPYSERCILSGIRLAGLFSVMHNNARSRAWLKAAQWVHSVNVADDPTLFRYRFAQVLRNHAIDPFTL